MKDYTRLNSMIRNEQENIGLNTSNNLNYFGDGAEFKQDLNNNFESEAFQNAGHEVPNKNDMKDDNTNHECYDYEKLVNLIRIYSNSTQCKLDVAYGSICLELKRLIYKCNVCSNMGLDPYTLQAKVMISKNDLIYTSIIADPGMRVAESCIYSIIDPNNKNYCDSDIQYDLYSDMLINTIKSLFDIYHIHDDDDSNRVFKFIDYFIESFVKTINKN